MGVLNDTTMSSPTAGLDGKTLMVGASSHAASAALAAKPIKINLSLDCIRCLPQYRYDFSRDAHARDATLMREMSVRRPYRRRRRTGRRKPSFAHAIAKSSIMRNAGNVNIQVMNAMCRSLTTVDGSDGILVAVDRLRPRPAAPFEQQARALANKIEDSKIMSTIS
jgi:hypothetical protein